MLEQIGIDENGMPIFSEITEPVIAVDSASFRIALTRMGIREIVESLISTANQDIKDLYEYKTEFHSNNKILNDFATANNMFAELQQVFVVAQQVMQELR
jgi:DNA integrity scanning protein DisA with diadenylate cyclase activity